MTPNEQAQADRADIEAEARINALRQEHPEVVEAVIDMTLAASPLAGPIRILYEVEAVLRPKRVDEPRHEPLSFGVPYAMHQPDGAETCPVCGKRFPPTGWKDFETPTTAYAAHYVAESEKEFPKNTAAEILRDELKDQYLDDVPLLDILEEALNWERVEGVNPR